MQPAPAKVGDHATCLLRVARVLLEQRDYAEVLAALLDVTIEVLGADRGALLTPDDGRFHVAVARNFRSETLSRTEEEISRSIAAETLRNARSVLLGDAQQSDFSSRNSVQSLAMRSVLCAPVASAGRVYALLYLENRTLANCFGEKDSAFLDEIVKLAAPRLEVAVAVEDARKRAQELEAELATEHGIVTADPALMAVLQTARQVARTDLPVLILGETGTGKELVAKLVHRHSARARTPLVSLNCAVISSDLIGSELFGHVRGAFTGAVTDKVGFIGAANRGTLFLDEIGDMPAEHQAHLLRVLQSGEYNRLGSVHPETVDVRVIAATNHNLDEDMEEGRFRADLFYRLSTITLRIPPLRERRHDIPLLCEHFLRTYAARFGKRPPVLAPDTMEVLTRCPFLGNVRELESEMARLTAITPPGDVVTPIALNERITGRTRSRRDAFEPMTIAEMEKRLIDCVLEHTDGNRTRAAQVLGITREGLRMKLQRLASTTDAD